MTLALSCQLILLIYHQITTFVDFFPFNGARHYARQERLIEMGVNAILMGLAPIGFILHKPGLMLYGAVYYFVLFAMEIIIWWIPYFTVPSGAWRRVYNFLLSLATSNFESGDTLDHWIRIHQRIHAQTWTALPVRAGRITPNIEHTVLHAWTLVTAIATLVAYRAAGV